MGLFKVAVTFFVELTTFTSSINPFSGFGKDPSQAVLGIWEDIQHPLVPSLPTGAASCPEGKVCFHPDGSSPGFQCEYDLDPSIWLPCNKAKDRNCWIKKRDQPVRFDIDTDYENPDDVPKGKIREYLLIVDNVTLTPAFVSREGRAFNGTYPGPKLEACWGDQIVVQVKNQLKDMGTTVHWHGIRQFRTNHMDGVPVTQCPIIPGGNFTYNFTALQYGHTWYHSHYGLQYADGLAGPLVIYGPTSADWDNAAEPLLISDWVQKENVFQRYVSGEIQTGFTAADAIVVNGIGHNGLNTTGPFDITNRKPPSALHSVNITANQTTLLRIINGAAATSFIFSIDGHNFTVISSDLVAIEPFKTNSIVIGIGQRYTILIHGLAHPESVPGNGSFWIRTHPADGCNIFTTGTFNSQSSPSEPFDVRTAVLHYPNFNIPTTVGGISSQNNERCSKACVDEAPHRLQPIVRWTVDDEPLNVLNESTFLPALQNNPSESLGQLGRYRHWMLRLNHSTEMEIGRNMSSPLWIDFANPTMLDPVGTKKKEHYNIVDYSFPDNDGFIYMVIDGSQLPTAMPGADGNTSVIALAHPIHWHGSDVVVLGQSTSAYDPLTSRKSWNFDNPPRRDVVMVPAGGYVAVAFKPDNPGAWLVHCHIAWHASAGLALQMVLQGDRIKETIGDKAWREAECQCDKWKEYNAKHPNGTVGAIADQDESGI
ncbi:multicopper oxidase-domain-containing protein [Cercophora scortea]|uniref:Multicopper oxidase-domain-containing protein n=1 Tax=Cercophora scortea TaxID=314031 RepID=A0AAE0I759_9PEZI|nr:multicopper oxidase-domain-containing protein [Cercophora scortea]